MHFEFWQLVACWRHYKHALSRYNKVQACFYLFCPIATLYPLLLQGLLESELTEVAGPFWIFLSFDSEKT